MNNDLSPQELVNLIKRVFEPQAEENTLAFLVDLPDEVLVDNDAWRQRRKLVVQWVERLSAAKKELNLTVALFAYRNAHVNNGELPEYATPCTPHNIKLDTATQIPFAEIFKSQAIILAPTELSATAPLKNAAKTYGFRGVTMPGFCPAMIPALRLDYAEINRRCALLKRILDSTQGADFVFIVDKEKRYELHLDLRHRMAIASGGVFVDKGLVGNLPSGETYIVPYEGELTGDATRSQGTLPVQFNDEVVLYTIEANRATRVISSGQESQKEAGYLEREPAYGNMAELGLGVLTDFGLQPIGQTLVDEKLGLHIAFGRSDHFGGEVGAAQFTSPANMVHIDRVYLPSIMPRIVVASVDLKMKDGSLLALMRDGEYVIEFT